MAFVTTGSVFVVAGWGGGSVAAGVILVILCVWDGLRMPDVGPAMSGVTFPVQLRLRHMNGPPVLA